MSRRIGSSGWKLAWAALAGSVLTAGWTMASDGSGTDDRKAVAPAELVDQEIEIDPRATLEAASESSDVGQPSEKVPVAHAPQVTLSPCEGACDPCCDPCDPCDPCARRHKHDPMAELLAEYGDEEGLFDNFSMLAAIDGSKQPQDLGVNAQFGGRFAVDWGIPLVRQFDLGLHIGSAIDAEGAAVNVLERVGIVKDRFQSFTTVGLFQRTPWGIKWGFGHDFLFENYYDNFDLGQWRGVVAFNLTAKDEIGTWFAISGGAEDQVVAAETVKVRAITQGSVYWRHIFSSYAQITGWIGAAESHGGVVLVFPDNPAMTQRLVFGSEVRCPLNEWMALFGQANFITPVDTGTVDAYLGIALYPARTARKAIVSRYAPVMAVASNPTFAVDLRR